MSIDSSTSGASPAKRPVISLKFLIVSLLLAVWPVVVSWVHLLGRVFQA